MTPLHTELRQSAFPVLSVAPMMDWSNAHMRHFLRLALPDTWQYTEMVTAGAVIHGDRSRLLARPPGERNTVLQLGGSDPQALAQAAAIGREAGFDAVNLNCGCPSPRVQRGAFGACLMTEPALVARCVAAMRAAVDCPVTVKCRLGVDSHDDLPFLERFVRASVDAGSDGTVVHARIALLEGLSPRQNREIPPLCYARVLELAPRLPGHPLAINGGIRDLATAAPLLAALDGVMVGRLACERPWAFLELARALGEPLSAAVAPADDGLAARRRWLEGYLPYARDQHAAGVPAPMLLKHVLNLYHGLPGGRRFRQCLSGAGATPLRLPEAIAAVEAQAVRERDRRRSGLAETAEPAAALVGGSAPC